MLTGDNGILTQANKAKIENSHSSVRDAIAIAYNEYQIEINTANNTKIASIEKVQIQGKEEKSFAAYTSFLDFLASKGYIKEGTTDVLEVEKLTGGKQALGNGIDNDIYKIKEEMGKYVIYYYDKNMNEEEIWNVKEQVLESDEGKEALILVYEVEGGKSIELPYELEYSYYDDTEKIINANYDFKVDWGDGQSDNITNENIEELGTHKYSNSGTYEVTITGDYTILFRTNNLKEVKQWGTTGLVVIDLYNIDSLEKIASPTENSFRNLIKIRFKNTSITEIPNNLFANCPKLTNFDETFYRTGITEIPDDLFANCQNIKSLRGTFECTLITNISEKFFENINWESIENIAYCFSSCYELEGNVPEIWLKGNNSEENNYIGNPNGEGCFYNSKNIYNYDDIPEYWKSDYRPR